MGLSNKTQIIYTLKNGEKIRTLTQYMMDAGNNKYGIAGTSVSALWIGTPTMMGVGLNDPVIYTFPNDYKIRIFARDISVGNTSIVYSFLDNNDNILGQQYSTGYDAWSVFGLATSATNFDAQIDELEFWHAWVVPLASGDEEEALMWNGWQNDPNFVFPTSEHPSIVTLDADFYYPTADTPDGSNRRPVNAPYTPDNLLWTNKIYFDLYNNVVQPGPDDPNEGGGTSGPGGGTGDLDDTIDPIDFPELPTTSALDTGFVSLYAPTLQQVMNLSSYMWTTDFADIVKKLFANPADTILSFGIIPVDIPTTIDNDITVAGVSTGISMNKALNQYIIVDCGSLDVKEYWGSCLDYAPYTKIQLYCPFTGYHPINTDDFMAKRISLKYYVDILSGSFSAMVKCNQSILYTFAGNCLSPLPITGSNWSDLLKTLINTGTSIATTVLSAGTTAPITAAAAVSGIMSTANNVMNSKPTVEHGGSIGSTSGLLSVKTPYIIIERPKQSLPKEYMRFRGYPCNITASLGNLNGYTEVEYVHLEGIPATIEEINEINELLMKGVRL